MSGTWTLTGEMHAYDRRIGTVGGVSLAPNWLLTPTFSARLDYRHVVLDRYGVRGHSDGIMARLVLLLE